MDRRQHNPIDLPYDNRPQFLPFSTNEYFVSNGFYAGISYPQTALGPDNFEDQMIDIDMSPLLLSNLVNETPLVSIRPVGNGTGDCYLDVKPELVHFEPFVNANGKLENDKGMIFSERIVDYSANPTLTDSQLKSNKVIPFYFFPMNTFPLFR
ncbi:hypothetical protein ACOME3_001825 [Neoechinorhynchus agilis]